MSHISTLSEFLLQAGTEYRVYDIGRGIRYLPDQAFLDIEHGKQPYPYPRQSHAWLGIVFWNKNLSKEHYIWFLKLALDETSALMSASRDHFLSIVIEALEKGTGSTSDTLSNIENPYSFTPSQQTMADFNAMTKKALKLQPSQYYQETVQFLSAPSVMNWQQIATQGIADFCARIDDESNIEILIKAYPTIATPVHQALLSSLENYELSEQLAHSLIAYAKANSNDTNLTALTLRALAQSQSHAFVQHYVISILNSELAKDINVLSVVVARHWQLLIDEHVLTKLLEQAVSINIDVCVGLYKDLVMIPLMRQHMLNMLIKEAERPMLAACLAQLKKELIK
jgi:hypothetical protein